MAERRDSVKWLWHGQARSIALWVPVLIGLGIWLRLDGPFSARVLAGVCLVLPVIPSSTRSYAIRAAMAVIVGIVAAEARVHLVAAPVLAEPWRGEISGRVRVVDASISGAPRLTLDRVVMEGVGQPPLIVRVSLGRGGVAPRVGDMASLPAVLAAPRGPAEPGGFDFSRKAYFDGLGAVGYAVGAADVERVADKDLLAMVWVDRLRGRIAASLRARIGGIEGAVAAALTVGDRSGIPAETRDALRDSGLAHLLAISGLHVGLLAGLVYWAIRLVLALPPQVSERVATRKVAASCALAAAAVYLVMSGASVATQRAFIMASVALLAIVFDRAAVTMRGLAVAAAIILLARPESLFEAGFQMSFAAVAALVAGYDATRGFWRKRAEERGLLARLVTGALATTMTSVLAGMATAPFAAYHFNRLVIWGLPANLLATPLMGLWIMPCIVLSAILVPIGLEGASLVALGIGIGLVIDIATWFGGVDGAVRGVLATSPVALSGITIGGLWLVIWRGWGRLAGLVVVVAGLVFWSGSVRPDLLVARDAALIAGRNEDGRLWVSRARAESYTAQTWLRRDGEVRPDRKAAYERREWSCTARRCRGWTGKDWRIVYLRKGPIIDGDCQERTILVAPHIEPVEKKDCMMLGRNAFAGRSSLAIIFPEEHRPVIRTAYPWSRGQGVKSD